MLLTYAILCIAQADQAIKLHSGQPTKVSLDKSASQDFTIALSKGTYRVFLDTKGLDGENPANVVQGTLRFLKQNGSSLTKDDLPLLSWYEYEPECREVKTIKVAKDGGFRFRLKNSDLSQSQTSIVVQPTNARGFVPFGFGSPVTEGTFGERGTGGTLPYLGMAYQRFILKPGKWSISLGMDRVDADGYVAGTLRILNADGTFTQEEPSKIDTGTQGRCEKTLSVKAATTIIVRAKNISNNHSSLKYDITVRPSDETQ